MGKSLTRGLGNVVQPKEVSIPGEGAEYHGGLDSKKKEKKAQKRGGNIYIPTRGENRLKGGTEKYHSSWLKTNQKSKKNRKGTIPKNNTDAPGSMRKSNPVGRTTPCTDTSLDKPSFGKKGA